VLLTTTQNLAGPHNLQGVVWGCGTSGDISDAVATAVARIEQQAANLGADAVIGLSISTNMQPAMAGRGWFVATAFGTVATFVGASSV
jgi:uncharacterized protein YbjQ (UPF0145 family)